LISSRRDSVRGDFLYFELAQDFKVASHDTFLARWPYITIKLGPSVNTNQPEIANDAKSPPAKSQFQPNLQVHQELSNAQDNDPARSVPSSSEKAGHPLATA